MPDSNVTQFQPKPPSSFARDCVDIHYAREVARVLYQRDRRDPRAELSDFDLLDATSQQNYIADAAVVIRMRDDRWHRPALYVAAHRCGFNADLDRLGPVDRRIFIAAFEQFVRVYRQALAGAFPDERKRFATLAQIDAQPTTTQRST